VDGVGHAVVLAGLPDVRDAVVLAQPSHGDWIRTQRSWLVVERLLAYAPELNPVQGLWSSLKTVDLANLTSPTLAEVVQAHCGIHRACWVTQVPLGLVVTPARWTWRCPAR
jgi:hypothetical protein